MTPAVKSIETLESRIASIPAALEVAAKVELPRWAGAALRTVVTTGIGASEGPARVLASRLAQSGIAARFLPLAAFATREVTASLLVAFSQNLSPNARLAFGPQHGFDARWLVTSAGLSPASPRAAVLASLLARGVEGIVVPPESEDGMLVRVVGPAVASLIALRLAAHLGAHTLAETDFARAASAYTSPCAPFALDDVKIALIAAGPCAESLHGHRWKLLETLLRGDPSVWDVLQIAHGPLQSIHDEEVRLLVFETRRARPLVERLVATLRRDRHRLVRIEATREDGLALLEHTAAIDACLVATLRASPRDLFDWPGRGSDAPLYSLGED